MVSDISPKLMGVISIFRLLAGFIGLLFLAEQSPVSMITTSVQFLLICYLFLTTLLTLLWWLNPAIRTIIQGIVWGSDVLMATFLLITFSQPTTSAPALLPVLVYEADAYWARIGHILGSLAIVFVLLLAWWVRLWSHRNTFSAMTLGFWLGTFCLLSIFPDLVKTLSGSSMIKHSGHSGRDSHIDDEVSTATVTQTEDKKPSGALSWNQPHFLEQPVAHPQLTRREQEIYARSHTNTIAAPNRPRITSGLQHSKNACSSYHSKNGFRQSFKFFGVNLWIFPFLSDTARVNIYTTIEVFPSSSRCVRRLGERDLFSFLQLLHKPLMRIRKGSYIMAMPKPEFYGVRATTCPVCSACAICVIQPELGFELTGLTGLFG